MPLKKRNDDARTRPRKNLKRNLLTHEQYLRTIANNPHIYGIEESKKAKKQLLDEGIENDIDFCVKCNVHFNAKKGCGSCKAKKRLLDEYEEKCLVLFAKAHPEADF